MAERQPLNIKKVFEAPRQAVWDAWTKPEQFSQWYMPEPFSVAACEMDVRPGGKLRVDTKSPEGIIMPLVGEFKVVEEPSKLVMTNSPLGEDGQPLFQIQHTVVLAEEGGRTTLEITAEVLNAGPEAEPFLQGMEAGLNQAFDQMGRLIEKA